MVQYVYSPQYHVDIGLHVFPTAKYELVRERLLRDAGATPSQFVEPAPATAEC